MRWVVKKKKPRPDLTTCNFDLGDKASSINLSILKFWKLKCSRENYVLGCFEIKF